MCVSGLTYLDLPNPDFHHDKMLLTMTQCNCVTGHNKGERKQKAQILPHHPFLLDNAGEESYTVLYHLLGLWMKMTHGGQAVQKS